MDGMHSDVVAEPENGIDCIFDFEIYIATSKNVHRFAIRSRQTSIRTQNRKWKTKEKGVTRLLNDDSKQWYNMVGSFCDSYARIKWSVDV